MGILSFTNSFGQAKDSTSNAKPAHSPKKAVILSALLPGAGQVYNKKAWKVPIIYALGGTCIYFASINYQNYINFRNGFRYVSDTSNHTTMYFISGVGYNKDGLQIGRDDARKMRDLFIIGTLATYALNLLDANVDAQLFDFDMSDNLTLSYHLTGLGFGVRLKF